MLWKSKTTENRTKSRRIYKFLIDVHSKIIQVISILLDESTEVSNLTTIAMYQLKKICCLIMQLWKYFLNITRLQKMKMYCRMNKYLKRLTHRWNGSDALLSLHTWACYLKRCQIILEIVLFEAFASYHYHFRLHYSTHCAKNWISRTSHILIKLLELKDQLKFFIQTNAIYFH